MAAPRHIIIAQVNWWLYLLPILPILALGYAALMSWLPSWALLVALFFFFMWLTSLLFTLFTTVMRAIKQRKEPRP